MNLPHRIELINRLGEYFFNASEEWVLSKEKASRENGWFIPEFIELATKNIAVHFLNKKIVEGFCKHYGLPEENKEPRTVGIVMAGNIPLVGFHDFLMVFLSGHQAIIKPSSKDEVLIKHIIEKLIEWDPRVSGLVQFADQLKNCGAYIATGSNNSSRYFEYYFSKYPNIIRRNRTSVAILNGKETETDLINLADDVYLFFGLGCRNVTKIYVPEQYDFIPLLTAFKKYNYLADNHKYKNNYDYNLAIHILNNKFYMSNESIILVEERSLFSPIGQLHYEYYTDKEKLQAQLKDNNDLQCIVGHDHVPFGKAQYPGLTDYADGIDTMRFLTGL